MTRDLRALNDAGGAHLRFALRVLLPEVRLTTAADESGLNAWLHEDAESWATLAAQGGGRTIATQGGPRHLADELEVAWGRWLEAGEPALYDFGMTVTPDRQEVWCEHPGDPWQRAERAR